MDTTITPANTGTTGNATSVKLKPLGLRRIKELLRSGHEVYQVRVVNENRREVDLGWFPAPKLYADWPKVREAILSLQDQGWILEPWDCETGKRYKLIPTSQG